MSAVSNVEDDSDRRVSLLCELIQGSTLLKAGRSVSPSPTEITNNA